MSTLKSLVFLNNDQPFTTTLSIAEGVDLDHRVVIRLVRKYKSEFEELGPLNFESSKGEKLAHGGFAKSTEYAKLNEDQATFLMTLFKNSKIVLVFKLKLVKAFRQAIREIERLHKQSYEPVWQLVRDETKVGFKWMTENLKDRRAAQGKETKSHHYQNETRLINAVLSGKFAGLNRDVLSASDLSLMAELQRYNAMLIARDIPYQQRKSALQQFAASKLNHNLIQENPCPP